MKNKFNLINFNIIFYCDIYIRMYIYFLKQIFKQFLWNLISSLHDK